MLFLQNTLPKSILSRFIPLRTKFLKTYPPKDRDPRGKPYSKNPYSAEKIPRGKFRSQILLFSKHICIQQWSRTRNGGQKIELTYCSDRKSHQKIIAKPHFFETAEEVRNFCILLFIRLRGSDEFMFTSIIHPLNTKCVKKNTKYLQSMVCSQLFFGQTKQKSQ